MKFESSNFCFWENGWSQEPRSAFWFCTFQLDAFAPAVSCIPSLLKSYQSFRAQQNCHPAETSLISSQKYSLYQHFHSNIVVFIFYTHHFLNDTKVACAISLSDQACKLPVLVFTVAVTNHHRPSGLRQHRSIILQFRRSEGHVIPSGGFRCRFVPSPIQAPAFLGFWPLHPQSQ